MGEFEEKLNAILGDQAAMGQIMALAHSLGGGTVSPPAEQRTAPPEEGDSPGWEPVEAADKAAPSAPAGENPLDTLDPKLVQMGMRLLREYQSGDDRNAALLAALRPFLRKERYGKLDKAIQLARLSRVIRVAFQTMGGKGEDRV